jgi:sugar (pentulose or hexulose) kinase
VISEGLHKLFPDIKKAGSLVGYYDDKVKVGAGLHDSSAALIPYMKTFPGPFVIISTGTWCITLNPFNNAPLTNDELNHDCLCYLSYDGRQVKSSRLFSGYEHEQQVKKLAKHFNKPEEYYTGLEFSEGEPAMPATGSMEPGQFESYEEAYEHVMKNIVAQQVVSTNRVLGSADSIFIDGGFSRNDIFINAMADAFPACKVYAASVSQASARGAAMVMHEHWNTKSTPADINHVLCFGSRK